MARKKKDSKPDDQSVLDAESQDSGTTEKRKATVKGRAATTKKRVTTKRTDPKKARDTSTTHASTAEHASTGKATSTDDVAPRKPKKKAPRKNKASPRKKRARKKAAKKAAAQEAAADVAPPTDDAASGAEMLVTEDAPSAALHETHAPSVKPVQDQGADVEPDAARDDPPPPVAESADATTQDEAGPPVEAAAHSQSLGLDEPVEDLDAVLDEDDSAEAVARLIAETLATAEDDRAEGEPEVEPFDLGAEAIAPELQRAEPEDAGAIPEPVSAPGPIPAAEALEEGREAHEVDLGPVSTPEARDRLLAQALAHAEMQDARYRVPFADSRRAGRWKGLIGSLILVIAGGVAVAPPAWVRPKPPAQLNAAARARSIRTALLLQAQQVEAFRVRSQRLPDTLDELSARLPGIRYVKSGSRAYQLIAYEADGNAVVYDSASPAPAFTVLAATWRSSEGSS